MQLVQMKIRRMCNHTRGWEFNQYLRPKCCVKTAVDIDRDRLRTGSEDGIAIYCDNAVPLDVTQFTAIRYQNNYVMTSSNDEINDDQTVRPHPIGV